MSKSTKKEARVRRHRRLRAKVSGTALRPRFSVCFTDRNIYVQFIDDEAQRTLASASTMSKEFQALKLHATVAGAQALGKMAAEKAKAAGITAVVFDRGGFRYHGRVAALASAAREVGLEF